VPVVIDTAGRCGLAQGGTAVNLGKRLSKCRPPVKTEHKSKARSSHGGRRGRDRDDVIGRQGGRPVRHGAWYRRRRVQDGREDVARRSTPYVPTPRSPAGTTLMGFTFPATPSISLAHPPTSNTLTRSPPRPHPIIDRRGKGRGTIARDHVEGGAHVARHRPGWINQRGEFILILLTYGQLD
jgi:hypothetical protein